MGLFARLMRLAPFSLPVVAGVVYVTLMPARPGLAEKPVYCYIAGQQYSVGAHYGDSCGINSYQVCGANGEWSDCS
jgi:hypothetical protein